MASPSYPAALDALANPGPTTETDDAGYELDIVVARLQNCIMALETKLGIGAGGPPATAAVLRRTATGTSLWGQVQPGDLASPSAVSLLATTGRLGAPAAAQVFGSISAAYTSLEIRIHGRGVPASVNLPISIRFNGDTTTSYSSQSVYATGGNAANGGELLTQSYGDIGSVDGASAGGGFMSSTTIWLPDYLSTQYKSLHGISHTRWNIGTLQAQVMTKGVIWTKTAAITSIELGVFGGNWDTGTIISLYGYV